MIQTLHIENWHPAKLNEIMGSRWTCAKKKKRDIGIIFGSGLEQKITKATDKRLVEIIITVAKHTRGRLPDEDAFYKSTHDALVKCAYLIDDSAKWCEHKPTKVIRGESKSTTIILTDL